MTIKFLICGAIAVFYKSNRNITGLVFPKSGWLQQMIDWLNVREMNPVVTRLLFENATNLFWMKLWFRLYFFTIKIVEFILIMIIFIFFLECWMAGITSCWIISGHGIPWCYSRRSNFLTQGTWRSVIKATGNYYFYLFFYFEIKS